MHRYRSGRTALNVTTAVVLAREGGSYRVLLDGRERLAVLRGKALRQAERAVVGDRVTIDPATRDDDLIAIEGISPRESLLSRRDPTGRKERPIAANVNSVAVVTATARPEPNLQLIDRLLVVAAVNEIPAFVIANKIDLAPATPITEHLASAGIPVLEVSATRGDGVDRLRDTLAGAESVFTGPSGAGKSSLLNAVEPGLGLRVGEVSRRVGRGRHTTTAATMFPLAAGGFLVDTPGLSDVGILGIEAALLAHAYAEFREPSTDCRFDDCRHLEEPGCAVVAAVTSGKIPESRLASYRVILAELDAAPEEWE